MANWQYVVLKPAQKYLERIQPDDQLRIIEALDTLLMEPEALDIKPLKGRPELRLRVGKYRVLLIEDAKTQRRVVRTGALDLFAARWSVRVERSQCCITIPLG